jgi:site-specific DNA recombinase
MRLMYQLLLDERQSTIEIAAKLNDMGVPTSYARRGLSYRHRDGQVGPAQHVWRANSVHQMLRNPVYKGLYTFGRRQRHNSEREIVTCEVPALVSVETWDAAASQLAKNLLWSPRNATYDCLLKGLIKCGECGHLYIGDTNGAGRRDYVCYNHRRPTVLWGSKALAEERRCRTSLPLNAAKIEARVWRRLERYLRHPDEALDELAARLHGQADEASDIRAKLAEKQREQAAKQEERDTVVELFRKKRISERDLDRQLDKIDDEERGLLAAIAKLTDRLVDADAVSAKLAAAAALLEEQRGKLDGPEPVDRRGIIEKLVRRITVKTGMDEQTLAPRPDVYIDLVFDPEADEDDAASDETVTANYIPPRPRSR